MSVQSCRESIALLRHAPSTFKILSVCVAAFFTATFLCRRDRRRRRRDRPRGREVGEMSSRQGASVNRGAIVCVGSPGCARSLSNVVSRSARSRPHNLVTRRAISRSRRHGDRRLRAAVGVASVSLLAPFHSPRSDLLCMHALGSCASPGDAACDFTQPFSMASISFVAVAAAATVAAVAVERAESGIDSLGPPRENFTGDFAGEALGSAAGPDRPSPGFGPILHRAFGVGPSATSNPAAPVITSVERATVDGAVVRSARLLRGMVLSVVDVGCCFCTG